MLTAETINCRHAAQFEFVRGDLGASAADCHNPYDATAHSLAFASNAAQFETAVRNGAAILIIHKSLVPCARSAVELKSCVFSVASIPMSMAILLGYFETKRERFAQWGARHPTALVHATAVIGKDVTLGPYCVIGADAGVGDGCFIGAHTVIENRAQIGPRSILHPHVFVGSACEVGADCEIHPHTTIGSDGFGYWTCLDGKQHKIPQLGNVRIGDRVEIGSNCAVDRATLTSTQIRSGTKLDNICHIAHNCDLGEDGLFTAGFMMAGSTKIGRQFVTGGNSVVSAHLTLADNVSLAGRSSVTNNVTEAGRYGGYPLQPIKEALKTAVNVGHLNRMRKDLNSVMKHLRLDAKTLDEKSIEDGCLVVKDSVECAAGGNGIDAKKDGET
jgi:UDP-3-O-[3-hydroxymyristoyl] glucosamine N-acyltransferase